MQPRQILDTSRPVDPSFTYCIAFLLVVGAATVGPYCDRRVVGHGVCRVPPAALQRVGRDLRGDGPGRRPGLAGQGPHRQQRRARRRDAGVRRLDAARHAVGRRRRRPLPQAHRAAGRRRRCSWRRRCSSASPSSPTSSSTGCCSLASAVQAAAFALYLPARIAFIAEVVEPEQIGDAVVLSQTAQEAMRVIAPALAGVLIGLSWFGVGGVFLLAAGTSTLAARRAARAAAGAPARRCRRARRSPRWSTPSATCASRRSLGLVALTTIGVVVIAFPYLTFLPTLADERYDVGAGGYGVMAGIAGLGAVVAGIVVPRARLGGARPWRTIAVSGTALGLSLIALAAAGVVLDRAARARRRRRVRPGVPDDDAVADAGPVRHRLPRPDAEHGRARLQRVRPRRPPARPARRRRHAGGDARRDGRRRARRDRAVRRSSGAQHRRQLVGVELA